MVIFYSPKVRMAVMRGIAASNAQFCPHPRHGYCKLVLLSSHSFHTVTKPELHQAVANVQICPSKLPFSHLKTVFCRFPGISGPFGTARPAFAGHGTNRVDQ
ncbi:hypothetical protein COO20_15875 [Thalassospira marina]|uniref:Uncharacterized protein n=1 Tax=Thalassospira marina TaxID=2048283 RepID=A0A2N3KRI6_9PROT|nr:hypothetical protein COO20_15875 [Thalassospira marina]